MRWYLKVMFSHYSSFSGRASRQEYWIFFLIHTMMIMCFMLVDYLLFSSRILTVYYLVLTIIPALAVTIRRLHDQNVTGWAVLLGLIPNFGVVILLVFMCLEGTCANNRFGMDPKQLTQS